MIESQKDCYLCGAGTEKLITFPWLVRCANCGLIFNPNLSVDAHAVSDHFYDVINVQHRKRIQSVLLRIASERWKWLIHRLPQSTGKLLEVGCGTGEFLSTARQAGWSVDGLELSESFRTAARAWYELDLRNVDLTRIEPEQGIYDVVALLHVFEHLVAPLNFLQQIDRLLKPGGWLFMIVPNSSGWVDRIFGKYSPTLTKKDHFFHYNKYSLQAMITRAGFVHQQVMTREPDHHFWSSLYGFLGERMSHHTQPAPDSESRPRSSFLDSIKSNLPYWLGKTFLFAYYPIMVLLQRTDQGHEIFVLCQKKQTPSE